MNESNFREEIGRLSGTLGKELRDVISRQTCDGVSGEEAVLQLLGDNGLDDRLRVMAGSLLFKLDLVVQNAERLAVMLTECKSERLAPVLADAIGNSRRGGVSAILLPVFCDPSSRLSVRVACAHALGGVGAIDAVGAMIQVASDTASEAVLIDHVAEALGLIGGEPARDAIRILMRHDSPAVRYSAAHALGQLGDSDDLAALVELAETDKGSGPSGLVAEAARRSVAQIKSRDSGSD